MENIQIQIKIYIQKRKKKLVYCIAHIKILKELIIFFSISSCACSSNLANKIANGLIEMIKNGAEFAHDISTPGNLCFKNNDCYPENIFANFCCTEKRLVGKCCNMISYSMEER